MALPVVNAPKYDLTLPSTGERVSYRPYLVKEEKILMVAMESKDQSQMLQALKDVISACTEGGVNVGKLPVFDLEYLFLKIRSKSVGETSDLILKCTSCDAKNDYQVNLDDVAVQGEIKKDVKIKVTEDIGVVMKYPQVDNIQRAVSTGETKGLDLALASIVSSIDSIYDKDNVYPAENETQEELVNFVESLNSDQFQKLAEFFDELPTLRHNVTFKCIKCGEANESSIEGLQSFF